MTTLSPLDENNIHSIEFEAPLSAGVPSGADANRPFSIDLSLELERQLDLESCPPTPAYPTESHTRQKSATGVPKHDSLDPHVLAHIVKQLQQSLSDVTKDRDELLEMLAVSHSHEAEMKDALQHMTDKATTMEVELSDARRKMKDDEEAISMLRSKVEESRRGLMRLQTESRRQSMAPMTIDVTRAGLPTFGSPPSAKRTSFAPLTGTYAGRPNGHRRISSVSDAGFGVPDLSTSPNVQVLVLPEHNNNQSSAPPPSSRRYSGLFGRTSPQSEPGQSDALIAEIEALKKEVRVVKEELENTKHDLSESIEAQEASETCVKALREFIGENNIGVRDASEFGPLKLPPLPIMAKGESEDESKKASSASTWGFKLWKDTTQGTPTVPQSAAVASPAVVSSPQIPVSATPLSRKIGDFFSSRTMSISSVAPSTNTPSPDASLPQLQTNAAMSVRDSIYSHSDTSSMAEPISPPNEFAAHNIIVRDVTNSSELGSLGPAPEVEKGVPTNPELRQGVAVV